MKNLHILLGIGCLIGVGLVQAQTPPCIQPPPNLVSWWPAEVGASDVIGTNHGVVNGQVSYAPGKVGQGFQFDGVDDYLVASTNGLHFGTNDFSIEGWIKSTSTKTWNAICSFDSYSPAIYLLGTGRIQIYPSGGSLEAGYNDGQFHHFAVVRRAGEVTYYKDGVTNGVVGYAGNLKPLTFVIGWDYFSGDQFPGVIDELALYNRALTTAEVQGVFAAGAAGKCSGAPPPTNPSAGPVSITSIQAFPNERTSDDPPGNAIDGNTNTYTWSTESFMTANPAYLAVGFTNSAIHRLRLWKSRAGGGGGAPDVKNLDVQYTVETATPLSARAWVNVRRLTNGFGGVELMNASAVNLDGSVTGDIHESASSGYTSMTFEAVAATGLRIAFSNPSGSGFNHYRVGEIQVFSPGLAVPLAPSVALTSPTNGAKFSAPANITLTATASDLDGTVARVQFETGLGAVIGVVSNSPYTFTWTNVPAGGYGLRAVAYDNTGLSNRSAPVVITVVLTNNPPPTHTVTNLGSLQTQAAPRFNAGDGYFWTMTTLGFDAVGKIRVGEAVTIVDASVGGGGGATPYTMTILTGIGSKGTIALYDCNFGGTWFFYDAATGAKRSLPLGATPNLGANQCTLNAAAGVAANANGTRLYHHVGANIHEINPTNGASVVVASDARLGVASALYELQWDTFTGTLLGHGQDSTGKNHLYRIDPMARTVVEVSVPLSQWTWTVPDPDTGLLYLDGADRVHQFNPATGRLDTLSFTAGSFQAFSTFEPARSGQGRSLYGTVSASGNQTLVEIAGTFPFTSGGGQQPPTLAIQLLTDGRVLLSWPAEAAGFILQTTTTVAAPASWQAVTGTSVSANGRFSITISQSTREQFYRLIKTN